MKITKTVCDLCGKDIPDGSNQNGYTYILPCADILEADVLNEGSPTDRINLCSDCSMKIRALCIELSK